MKGRVWNFIPRFKQLQVCPSLHLPSRIPVRLDNGSQLRASQAPSRCPLNNQTVFHQRIAGRSTDNKVNREQRHCGMTMMESSQQAPAYGCLFRLTGSSATMGRLFPGLLQPFCHSATQRPRHSGEQGSPKLASRTEYSSPALLYGPCEYETRIT